MSYGELFESSDYDRLLEIIEQIDPRDGIKGIEATLWKGKTFWALGKLDESLQILNLTLDHYSNLKEPLQHEYLWMRAEIFNTMANCYLYQNKLNQVLTNYQKVLGIYELIGDNKKIARTLNNIGVYHHNLGHYSKCLDYLNRTLQIYKEDNDEYGTLGVYYNLAGIYLDMGEINKAEEYIDLSLRIAKKLNNLLYQGSSLKLFGLKHYYQADFLKALEYYKDAHEYFEKLGNSRFISTNYESIIDTLLSIGLREEAEEFLDRLKVIYEDNPRKRIEHAYKISKAKILKQSHKLMDKGKATELFQELMDSEIMGDRLDSIEGLIELLLDELLLTKNDQTLDEISELMENYITIAQDNYLYVRIIRILVFKSRFMIVKGDLESAERLLVQAETTAREKNLQEIETWVHQQHSNFEKEFENWRKMVDHHTEITERVNQTKIKEYIEFMSQMKR